MFSRIFHKLFSRKWELLILGAVVIIFTVVPKVISVEHWWSLGWDVTGYPLTAGPSVIILSAAVLSILHLRKIRAPSLWIMSGVGLIYGFIMTWMVNLQGGA